MFRYLYVLSLALVLTVVFAISAQAEVTAETSQDGSKVIVTIDGKPFAEYLTCSGTKPCVWPIIGPTGKPMTRAYPLAKLGKYEKKDHIHHRSLWFTHGTVLVDGEKYNFWHEKKDTDKIIHKAFTRLTSGDVAVVATKNDWVAKKTGKPILQDERTLTFGTDGENRYIDFDIVLTALDKAVTFGDDKEGMMGIRVAGSLKPEAKMGGKLVNALGDVNKAAWGKASPWVDYSGPVDGKGGETVGISVMNHPTSDLYPTRWHARTYGLCAANPFALSHFKKDKTLDGSYTIQPGDSLTFRYRFYFHKGDAKAAKVAEAFEKYAKEKK
jgi:hypothetical protein